MKSSLTNFQSFSGSKVLVTGHTGFKGAWLTRILYHLGANIVGVAMPPEHDSLAHRIGENYIEKQEFVDVNNFNDIHKLLASVKPDLVYHLAAQSLVRRSYRDPIGTFQTNVMGTINVLQASLNSSSLKGIVVTTTDKVYKNVEKLDGYNEEDPLGGVDPYSASKSAAEMGITAWQNLASNQGDKRIVSARAGNVVGGGDRSEDRLIPDLIRGFRLNQQVEIRNPNSLRPWQHVLDPLVGYLVLGQKLLNGEQTSDSYNFGPSDKSKLTVGEVSDIACELWPHNARWIHKPSQDSYHESQLLWLSSTRANKELDWENTLDARESIKWCVDWEIESDNSTPLKALDKQILHYLKVHE